MVKEIDGKYYKVNWEGKQESELTPEEALKQIVEDFVTIADQYRGRFVKIEPGIVERMQGPKNIAIDVLDIPRLIKGARKLTVADEELSEYARSLKEALSFSSGYHAHYIACLYFYIQILDVWYKRNPDAMYDLFMWCKEDLFDLYLTDLPTYMYVVDAFYRTVKPYAKNYNRFDTAEINRYQQYDHFFYCKYFGYHNIYKGGHQTRTFECKEGEDIFIYGFEADLGYGNGYSSISEKEYHSEYNLDYYKEFNNGDKGVDHLYILRFLVKTANFCISREKQGTAIYDLVDKLCYYAKSRIFYEDCYYPIYHEGKFKHYITYPKASDPLSIAECALYAGNPAEAFNGIDAKKIPGIYNIERINKRPKGLLPDDIAKDKALSYKGRPTAVCDAIAYLIYEGQSYEYDEAEIDRVMNIRKQIITKRGFSHLRPTTREKYLIRKRNKIKTKIYGICFAIIALAIAWSITAPYIKAFCEDHILMITGIVILTITGIVFSADGGVPTIHGRLGDIQDSLDEINKKLK